MHVEFEGIWVPIVTPFCGDGVDHGALARLARHLADAGVSGLVAGATTGEGALLHPGEQEAVFVTLRAAVPQLPIVLGISQASSAAAVQQARALAALGPDGLLITPPVYVRPSQAGLRRHFEVLAEAADLPVLLYNIPYRTGVNVELATLQELARDPRVVAVKECGGSVERMMRLIHETPLKVLSGDDNQNFAALCLGADGTIAASAHVLPQWHVRIFELLRQDRLAAARRLATALHPMISALFAEPNPAPLKAWLAQQGWCESGLREPFTPVDECLANRLAGCWDVLRGLESLGSAA